MTAATAVFQAPSNVPNLYESMFYTATLLDHLSRDKLDHVVSFGDSLTCSLPRLGSLINVAPPFIYVVHLPINHLLRVVQDKVKWEPTVDPAWFGQALSHHQIDVRAERIEYGNVLGYWFQDKSDFLFSAVRAF